jgi:hypothetical protein
MNCRASADVRLNGHVYGHKGRERERLIDLPARTGRRFVLAPAGPVPRERLRADGWELANPLDVTGTLEAYRDSSPLPTPTSASRSTPTSPRRRGGSAIAAPVTWDGRPVRPSGDRVQRLAPDREGVFAFSTADDVVEILELIDRDYGRHARAARAIAEEHFEARTVIASNARPGRFA